MQALCTGVAFFIPRESQTEHTQAFRPVVLNPSPPRASLVPAVPELVPPRSSSRPDLFLHLPARAALSLCLGRNGCSVGLFPLSLRREDGDALPAPRPRRSPLLSHCTAGSCARESVIVVLELAGWAPACGEGGTEKSAGRREEKEREGGEERSVGSVAHPRFLAASGFVPLKGTDLADDWGRVEQAREEPRGQLPEGENYYGLENFGNTCYCNPCEALYFCQPFREKLLERAQTLSSSEGDNPDCLSNLFLQIHSQKKKTGVIAPKFSCSG